MNAKRIWLRRGLLAIALAGLTLRAAAASPDAEREARKLEFLSQPVFSTNRNRPPPPDLGAPAVGGPATAAPALSPGKITAADNCGKHPYLGNYCFRPGAANDWTLCTDKWGGCIKSVARKE